jgi:signal transduction histidine kinase/CheY-like chemotaxis protein
VLRKVHMTPDDEETVTQKVDVPSVRAPKPTLARSPFDGPARLVVLAGAEVGRKFTIDRSAVLGRSIDCTITLDDPEVSRKHAEVRRGAGSSFVLEDYRSRNGTWLNGVPVSGKTSLSFGDRIQLGSRVVLLFTHRDPAEEDQQQRARLEAIGRLGAGIAHDFNNMVGAMMASLDYLKRLPEARTLGESDVQDCLTDMQAAARRAADLTPRLLSFARGGQAEHARADISVLCAEVVQLLRRTLDRSIRIEAEVAPGLVVMGDRAELHQLLMNLCLNARDAMVEGGTLTVRASLVPAQQLAHMPLRSSSQPLLMLAVQDTGVGMEEATRERIFEPFFTTKRHGGGYGVGLATVKEVVTSHGGHIDVESAPGRGSAFRIYLPAVVPARRNAQPTQKAPTAPRETPTSARVLLADDEEVLRRSLGRVLKLGGHEVLHAVDGADAVRVYTTASPRPQLVMLDLDMPNVGGEQAFEQLREIEPAVRVLFVTGHSDDAREKRLRARGAVGFVHKPCRAETLLEEVERALHPTPGRRG